MQEKLTGVALAKDASLRKELANSWSNAEVLAMNNTRLAIEFSWMKIELKNNAKAHKSKVEALWQCLIETQGPLIQASLYMIIHTQSFGRYINWCGMALTPIASTKAVELISFNYPDLNIKNANFGYDSEAKEKVGWLLAEAMMRASDLPFLEVVKLSDQPLTVEDVLKIEVDKDLMFRELDRSGHVCCLGPDVSSPVFSSTTPPIWWVTVVYFCPILVVDDSFWIVSFCAFCMNFGILVDLITRLCFYY